MPDVFKRIPIMKILVTGSNGQLGSELMCELEKRAPGLATGVSHQELDITDNNAVELFLRNGDFTHIINCAAYTAVDKAEEEKLQCSQVNTEGVTILARNADMLDMKLLHVSTDYVFDGSSNHPYNECDKPAPLSVYGSSKRKGETALLGLAPESIIIRTGWLYAPGHRNFVAAILNKAAKGEPISVVSDQIGTPTYATDLAKAIADIVLSGNWASGIYNYSNEGVASRYDFAVAILEAAGMADEAAEIKAIKTDDYPTPAQRPLYAVLDKSKIKATFGIKIPHWQASLRHCIDRIKS